MDMTNRETEIQTESGQISSSEEMLCEAEPAVGTAGGLTAVLKRKFPRPFSFFVKYWGLFAAPLIAFVLYMVQLAVSGVYPFGSDYVVASYDLSAQICPFIEHLFDVFDGKSSLFYSYAIAGGADVFGTFAYFFISPFSFIFLLFGDGNVYNACGIVMAFKLAAIAFSGAWFVKKLFSEIPDFWAWQSESSMPIADIPSSPIPISIGWTFSSICLSARRPSCILSARINFFPFPY